MDEIGRRADTNEIVIRVDKRYFRPREVDSLLGESKKAKEILGWSPQTTLEQLINEMVDYDSRIAEKEASSRL